MLRSMQLEPETDRTNWMNAKAKPARKAGVDGRKTRGDRVTQAYHKLRELIVWGKLAPGTRIIETDIAARLGVSRTPVRSALQRLQQEGYIVVAGTGQQSRLSVAPLTQTDARELFAIVSECEALAARWAAESEDPIRARVASELRAINDELARTVGEPHPDPHRVFDLDQAFHLCFTEAGAGPRLKALHQAVKPQSERYVRLYITALIEEIDRSVSDHRAVADAIEAGDPLGAKEAVLANWRNAGDRLTSVIERLGERGKW